MADRGLRQTQAEIISRGRQAEAELGRTEQAFADVRQMLLEAIAKTAFDQGDARERLYLSIQLLAPVQDMLRAAVNDGVAAEHEANINKIMGEARPN